MIVLGYLYGLAEGLFVKSVKSEYAKKIKDKNKSLQEYIENRNKLYKEYKKNN